MCRRVLFSPARLFGKRWPILAVLALGLTGGIVALGEPEKPPAPAETPAAGTSLTIEQIGDALESYGKNTTTTNGHTDYSLTVHRGKWDINVIVSLSPSGKVIWMTNSLTAVPDPGKVAPAALLAILKKNTEIGPMFFSIADGSLRISNPVANHDLSPAAVKAQVEALISTVVDTEELWKPEALATAPVATPAHAPDGNPLGK